MATVITKSFHKGQIWALPFYGGYSRGLPHKNFEISGSEKCISVVPGDVFAMDNGESKKTLRSDRGVPTPQTLALDPPLSTNRNVFKEVD